MTNTKIGMHVAVKIKTYFDQDMVKNVWKEWNIIFSQIKDHIQVTI